MACGIAYESTIFPQWRLRSVEDQSGTVSVPGTAFWLKDCVDENGINVRVALLLANAHRVECDTEVPRVQNGHKAELPPSSGEPGWCGGWLLQIKDKVK